MNVKRIVPHLIVVLLVAFVWLPTALSQDDIVELKSDAFMKHTRPAAVFMHDAHNEKAGLEDCFRCHHLYEDGKLVPEEDSAGTACADCHALKKQGGQPGLMTAYHKQCKGCHVEQDKGPLACGQCHVKD
ncbi:acidic tetraheme cytochrome c3 TmcA [Desulfovibrio ferrophilus]|uniref:Cytochrome c class III n=1 Tax=Desulfovibrio ferrophilus TaxID=241368 RepID=A0A2Z6AY33_9BACT|nr:cytochrome c3 family protein [Desulfovibrio ferrophilus]BBD08174.1 cytochrome c class III [Desulfovibrio ferrophilus]